jgi:outer membrane protein assembly factor BamB
MKNLYNYLLYAFLLLPITCLASENDTLQWTQFRGSDRMGIDTHASAPVTWDSSDFTWNITLPGIGHASPVVWGNKIFITSADDATDMGYVMAVDERDGHILWQKEFKVTDLAMHVNNNLASSTPAVDESQVYIIWYTKEKTSLAALSHEGVLQWQSEFGGIETRHGGGSSLMLTATNVVFTREQENESSLKGSWVAVNKRTGKTAWELERETVVANSFSTPILVSNDQQEKQLIFTSQAHGFTCVDPETGQILWEKKELLTARAIASPLYAEGLVIGCRKGECMALKVDLNAKQAEDTAHYSLPNNLSPYVPTPIIVGELLFLFMDNGNVACVRLATGELLWKERPAGPIYGSPIWVDGNLYCITKAGKVLVIDADSTYQLQGIYDLGEGSFSTPVMCGSGMVFRTLSQLRLLGKD